MGDRAICRLSDCFKNVSGWAERWSLSSRRQKLRGRRNLACSPDIGPCCLRRTGCWGRARNGGRNWGSATGAKPRRSFQISSFDPLGCTSRTRLDSGFISPSQSEAASFAFMYCPGRRLSITQSPDHSIAQFDAAQASPSEPRPTSISLSTFQVFKLMTATLWLESQET